MKDEQPERWTVIVGILAMLAYIPTVTLCVLGEIHKSLWWGRLLADVFFWPTVVSASMFSICFLFYTPKREQVKGN